MKLTKKIEAAIEPGSDFYWIWEAPDWEVRTATGGYTLRKTTVRHENGGTRSRKIYQTCEREKAQRVHGELIKRGVDVDQSALEWEKKFGCQPTLG